VTVYWSVVLTRLVMLIRAVLAPARINPPALMCLARRLGQAYASVVNVPPQSCQIRQTLFMTPRPFPTIWQPCQVGHLRSWRLLTCGLDPAFLSSVSDVLQINNIDSMTWNSFGKYLPNAVHFHLSYMIYDKDLAVA